MIMLETNQYVAFGLDQQSFCLGLPCVERAVHVAATVPLPGAPEIVMGILNLNGEIIPVVNIRRRFRLPDKDIDLSDQFIIARTARRKVAILVDAVTGVIEAAAASTVPAEEILPGTEYIAGVIKLPDGMVLIHDLDAFLSLEEERKLDSALSDFKE